MLPMLLSQNSRRLLSLSAVFAALAVGGVALADEPPAPVPAAAKVTETKTGETKAVAPVAVPSDGKLLFNFRYQPWQDVLDWFAQQADLSLVIESPPPGTFNYHDSRRYTVSEALDVLNSVLLTKGYTLVRSGRMLVLVNLEDGIPPNLVSDVPLEELDKHGDYELIRVLFPVSNMSPEDAAKEVQSLLGPQGTVVTLPQAKQIQVTETGGRLRTIRRVINAVERPTDESRAIRELPLKNLSFDDAMPFLRQMLGIPDDAFSTPDGSLHVAKDVTGWKLLVSGTPSRVSRVEEVLKLIDVPEAASGIAGAPQLEVYSITSADPQAVLDVLKTLLEGDKSVKLAVDTVSGHLVAFARPAQQSTIRATIDQMQRDSRQVAVIPLSTIDPQVAVLSINKLFGGIDKDKPDASAPRVDADLTTRSLLVRGTGGQVSQIRDLLSQLGENQDEAGTSKSKERVRMLPLTGAAARSAISQIEQVWSTMRPNRIRLVTPSQSIPTYTPSDRNDSKPDDTAPTVPDRTQTKPADGATDRAVKAEFPSESEAGGRIVTVAMTAEGEGPVQLAQLLRYVDNQVDKGGPSRPGAPIVVAPGPGGVLIASDDIEALNDFEELLTTVAGRNSTTTRDYAVFYLKYSKAANVADVLSAIFGGSAPRGGGIMNDIAGAAMGDMGGGIMGDLLLGGGGAASTGGFTSGTVDIVPDVRLNALIVRAKQGDLDTVEQLLQVLDQRVGPEEVQADARPRLIPVNHTQASQVAAVVQQIYADRISGGSNGQMSPQDMLKMIRGGGKGQDVEQQLQKMSIGVDERSNSLVVRAPDPLFEEVKALVAELDEGQLDSPSVTRVVSLKNTNSAAVQKALSSMLGSSAVNSTSNASAPPQQNRGGDDDSPDQRARREFMRNMDMMRQMRDFQRMQDGGGPGGPGRGRGGPGGPGGGGPGGDRGGRGGGDRGGRGGN